MKQKRFIPFGRLSELRSEPNPELLAYRNGRGVFDDCEVMRYKSRLALKTFLSKGGAWHAVVKTPTERNMILHPNWQTEASA